MSKRVIIYSGSQTIPVIAHQMLWQYSDGDPLTGASNAAGVGTNHDSWWIADYQLMTGGVRTTNATDDKTVSTQYHHVTNGWTDRWKDSARNSKLFESMHSRK